MSEHRRSSYVFVQWGESSLVGADPRPKAIPNRRTNTGQSPRRFFRAHRDDFDPRTIYRAKTLARFQSSCQRSFVDLGLMPLLEQEAGQAIERLLLGVWPKRALRWGGPKT